MNIELSPEEMRVVGCLMEKAVTTPDQYPLTLNALTAACNQKSSREPVMSLTQGEVQRTARQLQDKYLVSQREGSRNVEKYAQRLCNTPLATYQFSPPEFAVVCVLLLRGPQTPGELRTRTARLHAVEDNADVVTTLNALIEREGGPVVARLPRKPGRQDHEYQHLFAGEIESVDEERQGIQRAASPNRESRLARLEDRVERLEKTLGRLAERLGEDISDADNDSPAR